MRLVQHIPGFVSGVENKEFSPWHGDPNTVPWLKHWREDPDFDKFSFSKHEHTVDDQTGYLMAEMKSGAFWVVAYVKGGEPELPAWIVSGKRP